MNLLTEYDRELHIRCEKELSFQEGKEIGIQEGKKIGRQMAIEAAYQEGRKIELQIAMEALIDVLVEMGVAEDKICNYVVQKFDISNQQAEEILKKHLI